MRSTSRLRRMARRNLGIFSLSALAAGCSLINRFDEVKPAGAGGSAGTVTAGAGGSGTGGGAGSNGSGGGAGSSGAGGAAGSNGIGGGAAGSGIDGGSMGGSNVDGSAGASGGAGSGGLGAGGSALSDASNDALADAEGGAIADRGADAPRVVTCQFTQAVPRLVDDYQSQTGANRTLSDGLAIQAIGNGSSIRILAQHQGGPDSYLEYFASDVPGGMMQTITSHGRVVDVRKKDQNTTCVLVIDSGDPGMPGPQPATLALHQFDDASSQSMPTITTLTNPNQLGTSYQVEARFSPVFDGIALAASYQLASLQYRAVFGVYTGTPVNLTQVEDDVNPEVVRPQAVLRAPGGMNYIFANQAMPTEFAIGDMGVGSRQFPGTAFVVDASMGSNRLMNIVMADFSATLRLLVGQIDPSQAMTFDASQLAIAKEAASPTELPLSQPTITGDNMFMLGPTGPVGRELSFLWVDMTGNTRAQQKLMDTTGLVKAGAVVARDAFGNTLGGRFHVVWVERLGDSSGDYDRLYYDQLQCF